MIIQKVENNVYSFKGFTEEDMDWKNFAGEKKNNSRYAPAHPNFCLYIPEDLANELRDRNVTVKIKEPRNPGDEARYQINLKINMDYYIPPEVYIRKTGLEKEMLGKDDLYILDHKQITYGEMLAKINYNQQTENVGTLYVNLLGVKVRENPFDADWAEQEFPQ